MEDKRYLDRINWNFDNYHKFDKCYCQSKTYYCNHDKGSTEDNEFDEADTYNIKYYNSKDSSCNYLFLDHDDYSGCHFSVFA